MVILEFNTVSFLRNVIVPGFKALTFLSKKAKDFSDWSLCVEVFFTGTIPCRNEKIVYLGSKVE